MKRQQGYVFRLTPTAAQDSLLRQFVGHKDSSAISKNHAVAIKEDLRVVNMTASAEGTIEKPGTNVAAKSGLNRRLQDQGWGEFDRQLAYKLPWQGGKLLRVDPRNTSRECNACHHISSENRLTQESF